MQKKQKRRWYDLRNFRFFFMQTYLHSRPNSPESTCEFTLTFLSEKIHKICVNFLKFAFSHLRKIRATNYEPLAYMQLPNGSYNGLVGMVERGEADLALPEISLTLERARVTDFPLALSVERQRVLVRNELTLPSADFATYVEPFHPAFWMGAVATLVACLGTVAGFRWVAAVDDGSSEVRRDVKIWRGELGLPSPRTVHFGLANLYRQV